MAVLSTSACTLSLWLMYVVIRVTPHAHIKLGSVLHLGMIKQETAAFTWCSIADGMHNILINLVPKLHLLFFMV